MIPIFIDFSVVPVRGHENCTELCVLSSIHLWKVCSLPKKPEHVACSAPWLFNLVACCTHRVCWWISISCACRRASSSQLRCLGVLEEENMKEIPKRCCFTRRKFQSNVVLARWGHLGAGRSQNLKNKPGLVLSSCPLLGYLGMLRGCPMYLGICCSLTRVVP